MRGGLVLLMWQELREWEGANFGSLPGSRWFCHVDDDNYVNVQMLVKLLSSYPHTQDIYIGKPSLDRPIQATERISENKMVSKQDSGLASASWG